MGLLTRGLGHGQNDQTDLDWLSFRIDGCDTTPCGKVYIVRVSLLFLPMSRPRIIS